MRIDHFYSDPHFNHARIIEMCNRPFTDIDDMREGLIERYNERVRIDDTVLWVGDCFFGGLSRAKAIMDRLNGRKILVRGNHDHKSRKMVALGFDFACRQLVTQMVGRAVRVSHYPFKREPLSTENVDGFVSMGREGDDRYLERHPRYTPAEILIHGHTHSTQRRQGNMIHVGVDAWDWRPASRAEVIQLVGEIEK